MTMGHHLARALVLALLAAIPASAQGPTGTVAGRIVDATTRAPVAGATVEIEDRGTVTDASGRFSITAVPAGSRTLRVTQIGYAEVTYDITVSAAEMTVLNLSLDPQAIELAEMVVTGYGTQRASEVASSIEEVTADKFNTGRVISPEQLIQGKVAGVDVVDSGEPGGGISVRIRGGTSITSSNEPLFVVDGVPLAIGGGVSAGRNPLNFLNPDDVEKVTVLKDAAATAIYGSRGANGVVIIETKGGSGVGATGSQLSYTGSISSSRVIDQPELLTADQFRQAVSQYAPEAMGLLGNANTDWRDAVQRDGMGHEHSVAFSGASGDVAYRFSVGYLNQEGVVLGSETERATLSLNYGQDLFDNRLHVTANIKGAHTKDDFTPGGVLGASLQFAPTQPIRDPDSPYGGFFEWYQYDLATNNPLAEVELTTDEGTTLRSVGDVEAEYRFPFLESLTATVRVGYDVVKAEREVFAPSILRGQAEAGLPGFVSRANSTQINTGVDAVLNYGYSFMEGSSNFDLTAGYAYGQSNAEFPYLEARGLSFDLLGTNGIPAAEEVNTRIWVDESKSIAFFGRANLSLTDRYSLLLSVRRDGSSKFGPDQEWGTFPAAGVAWRISNESFMQDVDLFDELKLRASWGVNGNEAFPNYQQYAAYAIGDPLAQVQFGDEFVTTIRPGAADPGIKWEETTSYNIGADFGILGNRLNGSLDYYFKETEDLIFRVPVAAGTNLSNFVTTNIGSVENRGFEVSLEGTILDGRDGGLSWIASINASSNDNELTRINPFGGGDVILTGQISGGVGNMVQVLRPGYAVNSFYMYRHRRNADGSPVWADSDGDGDIDENDLYEDINDDGIVNQDDRSPLESPQADWLIGHTSRMAWRSFDLSWTMRANLGNYVYNNVASNTGHYRALTYSGAPLNLHASVLDTGFESEQYFSDYYLEDGSFLRMDNLSLGYTFTPFRTGQQVRVFGTIQNVFTLTDYSGIDPLAGVNGIDNNIYPRARTFSMGATVRF